MPKPQKLTQFPKNHTDWNYNWGLLYIDVFSEANTLQKMYRDERRFQAENLPATVYMSAGEDDDGLPVEYLLEDTSDRRPCPSLLPGRPEPKVGCKTSSEEKAEYKEIEAEHVNSLRKRFSDYCAAVDEKQAELALENPEGASYLRFFRDKANFALQNYGSEAINDSVYSNIGSQTATIHTPSGFESDLGRDPRTQNFSFVMDQLSDMPFLPVFENATRMVSIACDHANAAKAGTLTVRQDRLSRRLLLTQYDHISGGVLESRRIVRDDNPAIAKDYKRWAGAMDNVPVHVSTNERAPLYVPDNLEGRRIALRQGWPVQDAAMIGSLYEMQARVLHPSANNNRKYTTKLLNSMSELFDKIGSTRITDSTSRMDMLDQIEGFLKENAKGLYLDEGSLNVVIQLRKAEKILPNQYLSGKELDEAAREYERRKALPEAAGSDRSPTGYYEQAVAGTEVLSRLSAMYEVMAQANSGRPDLMEYNALRGAVGRLIQSISGLYGPNPPEGQDRAELMDRLNAEHARISQLADTYLSKVTKREPAFKAAAARELKSFCDRTARTASATKEGMAVAEGRRSLQDWRIEKENERLSRKIEEPKVEESKVNETVVENPVVEEPVVEEPVVENPVVENPVVEEPVVENPVVEEPVVENSVVENPVVEEPVVEEPVVEDPFAEQPEMRKRSNSVPKPTDSLSPESIEQRALKADTAAFRNYLDTIWGEYQQLLASPVPDALDYRAAAERSYRIAELQRNLKPLQTIINDCDLDFEGIKQLLALSAQQEQSALTADFVVEKASSYFKSPLNTLCSEKKLEKRNHTKEADWEKLTPEQQKQKAEEIIREMVNGDYYDDGIFSNYATPQQKLAIAQRSLPPERFNRSLRLSLFFCLTQSKFSQEALKVYRHLPEVLGAEKLRGVVDKLDNDPVIHAGATPTHLSKPDADAIEALQKRVEAEQTDPDKKAAYLEVLENCKVILRKATPEAHEATQLKETASSAATVQYSRALADKSRQTGSGPAIDRNGPVLALNGVDVLPYASDEGMKKFLDMPKLPERARNAILQMLKKMDEMKLLPDDETRYQQEEDAKKYGYRAIGGAKERIHDDVINGNLEDLLEAKTVYDREYKNMEDLIAIAKGGFGSEYTNCPDMYVTRDPAKYPWELVDNTQQAQINSVYLLYQDMHKYKLTPEEFMDDFPSSLLTPWYRSFRNYCDNLGANTTDFAATMNVLMSPVAANDMGAGSKLPPLRGLDGFDIMPDEREFDRAEMSNWVTDAKAQFIDFGGRERLRYFTLSLSGSKENALFDRIRSESIQNLITVADNDRDINRMVGLPGYNEDLTLMAPFSLNDYIRTHEIDAAGMKQRLDTMIEVAKKYPGAPYKEELLAEGLEACTRVLSIHAAERDTEGYKALENFAQGLLTQLPQREGLSNERIAGLEQYQTRMENTMKRYRDFVAEPPLRELMQILDDTEVTPQANADFNSLRASVQSLSELSNSLMYPFPDGTLPKLTPQSREDLKSAYAAVSSAAAKFCDAAKDDPKLALARENAEKISQMASMDMNILIGGRGSDAVTLADVYQRRSQTLDISGLKPEVVGTGASRRYAFQIPTADGQVMDGFFTPDLPLMEEAEELDALNERIAKLSPDAVKAIRVMEEESPAFNMLSGAGLLAVPTKVRANQEMYIHEAEYNHAYDTYLKEAGYSDKEINRMAKNGFAEAIDEYLMSKLKITGRNFQLNSMGIHPGDPLALRNGAMSAVADALGIGSLLAASRPVTLVRNGKPVHGVFMDRATGSDCMSPGLNDPILKMTKQTPFSPKALQQLASLQVLDYICGNADRHPGNMLYSFTRNGDGTLVLDGIQGIDNDLSFMGCGTDDRHAPKTVNVKNLNNMPQSLADRVMQLTPVFLKTVLQEFRLPEKQIEQAAQRLRDVQQQITTGKEFFKDKEIDAVDQAHIHVLPDEDYAKVSPLVCPTKKISQEVPNLAKMSLEEHDRVTVRNDFRKDERMLADLYQKADDTDKAVWFGSKEFAAMKEALLDVGNKHSNLLSPTPQELKEGKHLHTITEEEMRELHVSYVRLDRAASAYLLRKELEQERKGSLDEKSKARVAIARKIKNMLQPHADRVSELYNAQGREARRMKLQQANVKAPAKEAEVKTNVGFGAGFPTAKERLDNLVNTLTEQCEKYKLVKNGKLDKKDPSVLSRKAVTAKLLEAFAMVELAFAAGNKNIRVDDKSAKLMCQALRTDRKKNGSQFEDYMQKIRDEIPDANTKRMHQDNYADMRKVLALSMNGSMVPERMEMLTNLLKDPNNVFGNMRNQVNKLEAENKTLEQKNQKPDNNHKPGL